MNNLKSFNTSKFNIGNEDAENPEIILNCYEKVDITVNFGKNTELIFTTSEKFNVDPIGSITYIEKFNLEEEIDSKILINSFIVVDLNLDERLNFNLTINEDIYQDFITKEKLKINSYITLNANFENIFEDSINVDNLLIGKDILHDEINVYEGIFTQISSYFLDSKIISANLILPPGKTLIINSDDFTAYLDGENVLDKYNQDWINLSRNVKSIEVFIGEGKNIESYIVYKERYL